jgi:hypothetical protein
MPMRFDLRTVTPSPTRNSALSKRSFARKRGKPVLAPRLTGRRRRSATRTVFGSSAWFPPYRRLMPGLRKRNRLRFHRIRRDFQDNSAMHETSKTSRGWPQAGAPYSTGRECPDTLREPFEAAVGRPRQPPAGLNSGKKRGSAPGWCARHDAKDAATGSNQGRALD